MVGHVASAGGPCWGIDVSKETLDIGEWPSQRHWQVPNSKTGWAQLSERATTEQPAHIVLEASGAYEVGVTLALTAAGKPPVVLNPMIARRFAQSHQYVAKTDRVDALMLARFGYERHPLPRPIPSETARDLAALLAVRDDLVADQTATKNRLQQALEVARPHLEAHLAALKLQIKTLEKDLATRVTKDLTIAATITLLASVDGIGRLLATTFAVRLPELGNATQKELAALAGVAPFAAESGKRIGPRTIRAGRSRVRRALFQAVTMMLIWNPIIKQYYDRLKAAKKPHKVAMVACMNRLLGLLNVMVRQGLRWNELTITACQSPAER